jgi:septal ring factor EnvC (AmiA/AmiB activator)
MACYVSLKYPSGMLGYAFLVLLFLCSTHLVSAQRETKELETIKDMIAQTQAQLTEKLADSDRLQQELKLAELKIAETATILNQTDTQLETTREELERLNTEKRRINTEITNQQSALASQIRSAYMAGDYDFAKMIFNQNQANKFERVLTYYQYLNKARQSQIKSFRGLIEALDTVQVELDQQEADLAVLLQQQSAQSKQLSTQQQSRFGALRRLEQQIRSDQVRVSQLQQQEDDLVAAIEKAELDARRAREQAEQADIELNGLTQLKGKLLMPTTGTVERLFGKRRQGQVRWKGIVINSKAGTTVKAVADGVVLYADWLKGFGLVVIVDHGEGYMSVYGRNQALLKNVGDTVNAGDSLSLVGTSGGQDRASLYFEIRHKGKALNPSVWIAR